MTEITRKDLDDIDSGVRKRTPSDETLARFRDFERDLRALTNSVAELAQIVSAQASQIKTLTDQIGSVFSRINQPTNWAVVIAAMVLLITGADLKVTPIEADIQRLRAMQSKDEDRSMKFIMEAAELHGYNRGKLEKMEHEVQELENFTRRLHHTQGDEE